MTFAVLVATLLALHPLLMAAGSRRRAEQPHTSGVAAASGVCSATGTTPTK